MRKILILAAMTAASGAANAAVIVNGGFEDGPNNGAFVTVNAGSTDIPGWTVGGNSVDYINNYWVAAEGSHSIDLSGNNIGSLSQTFATVAGKAYVVSYRLAGNPASGPTVKTISVEASGNLAQLATFDTAGKTLAAMGWVKQSYNFIADSTGMTKLTFSTPDSSGYGPALDDVSIATAVPESATWAMMIGGFGVIGGTARRRRRTVAIA